LIQDWNFKENQRKYLKLSLKRQLHNQKFGYWLGPNNFKQITRTNGRKPVTTQQLKLELVVLSFDLDLKTSNDLETEITINKQDAIVYIFPIIMIFLQQ
jgi:hypothetical protein